MGGSEGEPKIGTSTIGDWGQKLHQTQLTLAERKIRDARTLDPNNPRGIKLNADLLSYSGKKRESIEEYQKALKLDPNYAEALNNLGMVFFHLNQIDKANDAFQNAIELEPKEASYYVNLGFVHYRRGDIDKAISFFNKALELDSGLAIGWQCIGVKTPTEKIRRNGIDRDSSDIPLEWVYADRPSDHTWDSCFVVLAWRTQI